MVGSKLVLATIDRSNRLNRSVHSLPAKDRKSAEKRVQRGRLQTAGPSRFRFRDKRCAGRASLALAGTACAAERQKRNGPREVSWRAGCGSRPQGVATCDRVDACAAPLSLGTRPAREIRWNFSLSRPHARKSAASIDRDWELRARAGGSGVGHVRSLQKAATTRSLVEARRGGRVGCLRLP